MVSSRCALVALLLSATGSLALRGRRANGTAHKAGGGCCPSSGSQQDVCGTCYYYLDGWCAESQGNCAACGASWCTDEVRTCSAYGCNTYQEGRPCQCHAQCKQEGNCCSDYYARCAATDAAKYWVNVEVEDRSALRNRIRSGHEALTYRELWTAYKTVWVSLPGKCQNSIYDIYSSKCWRAGSEQCGSTGYRKEGDCYNREHSWPKSWWDRVQNDAYSDMFHVMPSDGYVNGKRGSLPFGEVDQPTYTSSEGNKVGPCTTYAGTCFEPTDEHKGLLARGHFYMSLRYSGEFFCCDKDGVSSSKIKPWYLSLLKKWHKEHPVEEWERVFNDRVQSEQGNRNPFIDFPDLVDTIF